ncbi:MAG: hypothetical protein HY234_11595 [Acidobacteria bacterium]|nr:hypothetical protein [Acidobacteriota bacterium]MBI3663676.1 hypothetical protein [Acidobacteriota bacterium]
MSPAVKGNLWCIFVILSMLPGELLAQQQTPSDRPKRKVELRTEQSVVAGTDFDFPPEAIAAMELGLDFRAIKERPFRAEMVVETDRRLADGNSLHRKSTSTFYRDHNGRLREERRVEHPGIQDEPAIVKTMVSINDPEQGIHYVLFPGMKAGFRTQQPAAFVKEIETSRTTPWTPQPDQNFTTEVLGYQMIEGLQCEGKLDTVTIPAGATGNPFPMEIVTERWYSAELQMNLLVKHRDPRRGETTIRLTNLSLEEPQESLFEIPPDYEIQEGRTTMVSPVDKKKP